MGYAGLLRLGNCIMAFLGVLTGAVVESLMFFSLFNLADYPPTLGWLVFFDTPLWSALSLISHFQTYPIVSVVLAGVAAFLVTGAGNALNDYYDRDLDKKAHPERPLPSGEVTPKGAWNFAMVLFAVGLVISLLVNFLCLLIAIVNTYVLFAYERKYKARGLSGNLSISYLTASVFLFGGASVLSFKFVPILFLLALLANVGREITKDIEDVEADAKYRRTLPMTTSKEGAARTATRYIWLAVYFSFVPMFYLVVFPDLGLKLILYLIIVVVADAIFIYSCRFVMKDPKRAQTLMKIGMAMAIVSFFICGLIPYPMNV